ncbi:MAG: hypothetical protein AB8H80_00245 [Planctomycetota bacterium]
MLVLASAGVVAQASPAPSDAADAKALKEQVLAKSDRALLPAIERRLQSHLASEVAWGGYLAQRYQLGTATKMLSSAIRRWQEREGIESRLVCMHLVDGLLGVHAKVPSDVLLGLLDDPLTREGATALMLRDPAAHREALLQTALQPAAIYDCARYAAAVALIQKQMREPKLARGLLNSVPTQLKLRVVDAKPKQRPVATSCLFTDQHGDPAIVQKPNFPPLVLMRLSRRNVPHGTVEILCSDIGDGAPISFLRIESANYQPSIDAGGPSYPKLFPADSVRLLKALTGVEVDLYVAREHRYVDAKTLLEEFGAMQQEHCAKLDGVVAGLRRRGWLSKQEMPGYRIVVEQSIVDDRGDTSEALPPTPELPAVGKR